MWKWIRHYVTWLSLAVCLAGCGMSAVSWWRLAHFNNVMARGTKAIAVIDRAHTISRKSMPTHTINLIWKDSNGEPRRANGVAISSMFAMGVIRDGVLIVPAVEIRYLADAPGVLPVIPGDAEGQKFAAGQLQIWGFVLLLFGAFSAGFSGLLLARMGKR